MRNALVSLGALAVVVAHASPSLAAGKPDKPPPVYTVTFVSHTEIEATCETQVCWDVTSPTSQAISHFILGVAGCSATGATMRFGNGTVKSYTASQLASMTMTNDPICGDTGIKFPDGFADGETRRLCMTYAGMHPLATGNVTSFDLKAGNACIPTIGVEGAACGESSTCDGDGCGEGVWTCAPNHGPAICTGAGEMNACGGCEVLPGSVGDACELDKCRHGFLACDPANVNGLTCVTEDVDCSDRDTACSTYACDPVDGACKPKDVFPDACGPDLDGNVCNGVPVCDPSKGCVNGPRPTCDNGVFCDGVDSCDPVAGCVVSPPCPSGEYCQEDTRACSACPDGSAKNACGGCGALPAAPGAECGDGDLCNPGHYACGADHQLACVTTPVDCSDHDTECSTFECRYGACVPVTSDDAFCGATRSSLCVSATCDAAVGCVESPVVCQDDGLACDGVEACDPQDGVCRSGSAPCAGSYCNEADDGCYACPDFKPKNVCGGCGPLAHEPGTPCGDACTTAVWACDGTSVACVVTDVKVCDDHDACNGKESCDPKLGCLTVSPGPVCDDGKFCNGKETCNPASGACVAGTAPSCDDGKYCDGTESCSESAKACVPGNPACPDGQSCRESDHACLECGVASDCDDDISCSTDGCSAAGTCTHDFAPCSTCTQGSAVDLGLIGKVNLLACGNFTNGTDVLGRVAVKGDMSMRAFAIASVVPGGQALVVGGNLSLTNGTVYGDTAYGGALTSSGVEFRGAIARGTPIDFAFECSTVAIASRRLAAVGANGTTTVSYGTITLKGTSTTLNVFRLAAADLNAANGIYVDVPKGVPTIINVVGGTAVTFQNFSMWLGSDSTVSSNDPTPTSILWNVVDATSVTSNIALAGTLLAPAADITLTTGHVDGGVIGKNVSGPGELHSFPFAHAITCPAPAPAQTCTATGTFLLVGSWTGGFQGNLAVKNTGTLPIKSWKASFSFNGSEKVSGPWNVGSWSQSGKLVTMSGASYTNAIAVGGEVPSYNRPGFNGQGTYVAPAPAVTVTPTCN